MTWVKICGVREQHGAEAVRSSGAELAGLNFVPTSKRRITLETAHVLARVLRPVRVVGIFADQSEDEITRITTALELDYVQLHGDEPPHFCRALQRRFRVIKAMRVDAEPRDFERWAECVDIFLFDGPRPGSGEAFDWRSVDLTALAWGRRFMLAGGLTPENVHQAVAEKSPWGVDVASGIEVRGVQDTERIRAFVTEAKKP